MNRTLYHRLALVAALFAFGVVVLGAYVRLSDAGLGCPDWPGCYGRLIVSEAAHHVATANASWPERPFEAHKAWKEMLHRYAAGTLGILILALAVLAWRGRAAIGQPLRLPLFLVALVVFQALLGMWTVTLLLKPLVVMLHLLGGMATLALLWLLALRTAPWLPVPRVPVSTGLRRFALVALAVLVLQLALGGWTSSNYAALACPDFPTCQNSWWPEADFREAFVLWRGIGVDYEGGVLEHPARVAIHFTHRLGALLTLALVGMLCLALFKRGDGALRSAATVTGLLLIAQVALGISTVSFARPLGIAVAHNGVAALLVLALVTLTYLLYRSPRGG
ncbi:MAG TPA: COX15/CtaA family protein [Gammaproteobacteria bacterium]|nr:COX15/CtaA family protein [Gammaproteobacteria bacterium]